MKTYRVVAGDSELVADLRSSVHPIHARSNELRGEITGEFDDDGRLNLKAPHGGSIEVSVATITSGNRLNDIEMQRRAEIKRYPLLRFSVRDVRRADADGSYRGTLIVDAHGRSRTVEAAFTLALEGSWLKLQGEHTFDMRDFGVQPPRILTLKVEPDVKVRVRLLAEETDGGPR
ncbi:MAG: YceI family protein [Candidatus Dormibacteraceae bacterium]